MQSSQIPLLIHSLSASQMNSYLERIRAEIPDHFTNDPTYEIIYKIKDAAPADYVRAIQETEILKTRVKQYDHKTRRMRTLPSFRDAWNNDDTGLASAILSQKDPHEAKWILANRFGYKLATTFMPMYAKAIYEYLGAERVLDPCAGWGDRMVGALSSTCVRRYVGFDPNRNLVAGYKRIHADFGNAMTMESSERIAFGGATPTEIHSVPFECGELDEKFDFAFTSPPFFDYEDYSAENPTYMDWYVEFYEPLFTITERHLDANAFFAVHIDDTSAGKIRDFLFRRVNKITGFQYRGKIGLIGGNSGKIRNVYLFQRGG